MHPPFFRSVLLSCALALCGLGALPSNAHAATELPDLGEPSRQVFSEADEARLGREIMRQIRTESAYLDDPEVEAYLNDLGARLAAANSDVTRTFSFFAVADPSINAFALPGGHVGVHTGLIAAARNESELAGVLAHEIAHVSQSHIARIINAQSRSSLTTLAALAIAILAARSNPQVTEAALVSAQALNIQNQLDYTREHEREADRVGFQTLSRAGFAPEGMATFFERLQSQNRFADTEAPAYLRTHPLTYERIADMQNRLAEIAYRQHLDSPEFALVRAKVMARSGNADAAVKKFRIAVLERPSESANFYGLAEAALRAGDIATAGAALAELQKRVDSPMVDTLAARVALADKAAGRAPEHALDLLRQALKRHAAYLPLSYDYVQLLLWQKRHADAAAFLARQRELWPEDLRLMQFQAETLHGLGQHADALLLEAEVLVQQDRPRQAIEQLLQAQRLRGTDFYTQSRIDARLRELRAANP